MAFNNSENKPTASPDPQTPLHRAADDGQKRNSDHHQEVMSVKEVEDLLKKANAYIDDDKKNHENDSQDSRHALCRWFYRNQSVEYFKKITGSDGIMKVHKKDNTGDPRSPINGRLNGIFFTATVHFNSEIGQPVPKSPFGKARVIISAQDLLEKASNIYFADFYCMPTSKYHYVTLVLAVPGSKSDMFCEEHLVKLKIQDNSFLFKGDSGTLQVTTAEKLFVEIFYTEDIDIQPYIKEHGLLSCETIKQGHTTSGGVPKKKSCDICNLSGTE